MSNATTRYVAGWNMPGYLPEMEPERGECPHCGELAQLFPVPDGSEPEPGVCRPCLASLESYGRAHIPEAWCPEPGCWNGSPQEDGGPCPEHDDPIPHGALPVARMCGSHWLDFGMFHGHSEAVIYTDAIALRREMGGN